MEQATNGLGRSAARMRGTRKYATNELVGPHVHPSQQPAHLRLLVPERRPNEAAAAPDQRAPVTPGLRDIQEHRTVLENRVQASKQSSQELFASSRHFQMIFPSESALYVRSFTLLCAKAVLELLRFPV